jgi:hypothetical protein
MATNITIVVTSVKIGILFNDLSPTVIGSKGADFKRSELIEVWHETTPAEHIKLIMDTGSEWRLGLVASEDILPVTSIKVDTGSVVIPTTIEELHTELNKLFI